MSYGTLIITCAGLGSDTMTNADLLLLSLLCHCVPMHVCVYVCAVWEVYLHICHHYSFTLYAAAIKMKIELDVHTGDETYLGHIKRKLPQALDEFQPDIVVYNAGEH